jgi:hypothetical protein
MKLIGILIVCLAGLATLVAIQNVFLRPELRPQESSELAGYIVGSFLVPIGLLIVGLMVLKRAK